MRQSTIQAHPRTQESLAVSADGESWYLLNASPEIRAQIEGFPPLHPRGPRHSPIAGVVLTNGDLDHCLGLFSLRESQPLVVYATEAVRSGLVEHNALCRTLERFEGQVRWRRIECGVEIELGAGERGAHGLSLLALPAPGKQPIHLEALGSATSEANVGLRIRDRGTGRTLAYVPGAGGLDETVHRLLEGADCVFFDGTFWTETELIDLGLGSKRARDMAHLPVGGEGGSLARLASLSAPRRFFIHVNNTNPVLREDSQAAETVRAAGWVVAHDGMELEL